jgi:hypothetical protein
LPVAGTARRDGGALGVPFPSTDRKPLMTMKIAIPSDDGVRITGHAGQARHWLLYDN